MRVEESNSEPVDHFIEELRLAKTQFLEDRHEENARDGVPRANELRLRGFRRYLEEVSLPLDTDFTLIYAENGVGKSTLVEALELIKDGATTRSRIAGPKKETNLERSIPSWGLKTSDVSATLIYSNGCSDSFSFSPSDNPTYGYFNTVTRANVRNRVTSDSNQRYKTLLTIARLDDLIPRLEELDALQKAAYDQVQKLRSDREKFENGLVAAGITSNLDSIDAAFMTEKQSDLESTTRLQKQRLQQLSQALTALESAQAALDQVAPVAPPVAPADHSTDYPVELIELLEKVRPIASDDQDCPVCQNGTLSRTRMRQIDKILADHQSQLEEIETFNFKRESRVKYVGAFRSKTSELANAYRKALDCLGEMSATGANSGLDQSLEDSPARQALRDLHDSGNEQIRVAVDRLKAEIATIESGIEQLESQDTVKKAFLWKSLAESDDARAEHLNRLKNVGIVEESFDQAKSDLAKLKSEIVRRKIEPIQESIEEWWAIMAPSYSNFDLKVQVKSGGVKPSVEFLCVYQANGSKKKDQKHALGHMSDSQLDLLSLAIEFAGHTPDDGLLWLDDPTDMLDDQTRLNFCTKAIPKLVEQGVQVALATHSREIVHHCWDAIHENPDGSFGDSFKQVNIEAIALDDTEYPAARFAPSDIATAREYVGSIASEIKKNGRQWSLGSRSMYANQLRRYAEFALASSNDLLIQICQGKPYPSGLSLSDNKATLGEYRDRLERTQSEIRKLAEGSGSTGLSKNLGKALDKMMHHATSISNSILNEGSHASTSVPTFHELESIHTKIDLMWPERNEIAYANLRAPSYFSAFVGEGQHVAEWNRIVKDLRKVKLRSISQLLRELRSLLSETSESDT